MIEIDKYDKELILLCKGHLKDQFPFTGNWHTTLIPWFTKVYGWNPDEDNNYHDYLNGMFNKLLDTYYKIQLDQSGCNAQIKGVFSDCFYKRISNNSELPIERGINALCGLIQNNLVIDKGVPRYNLK